MLLLELKVKADSCVVWLSCHTELHASCNHKQSIQRVYTVGVEWLSDERGPDPAVRSDHVCV